MIGKERHKSNDPDEAYTRNSVGRKEVRTFLKQFSLVTAYTGGDDVRKAEANTKGSKAHYSRANVDVERKARSRMACRGQRAWHGERETLRTWEPLMFPEQAGRTFQQKRRKSEDRRGVRSFHSTQRRESRPHGEGDDEAV